MTGTGASRHWRAYWPRTEPQPKAEIQISAPTPPASPTSAPTISSRSSAAAGHLEQLTGAMLATAGVLPYTPALDLKAPAQVISRWDAKTSRMIVQRILAAARLALM